MSERHARTRLLVGDHGLARLRAAHAAVIGLGGVGGYALEALARAGVGRLLLVDPDTVAVSNLNRQLLALESTIGALKVDVARERVRQIDPDIQVDTIAVFLSADNVEAILPPDLGYAVDAIDSVDAKVHLIETLYRRGVRFVSCMGTGNKLAPIGIEVADISKTKSCPLARAVRRELRKRGIETGVRCVYSCENVATSSGAAIREFGGARVPGTIAHVPGIAGLTAAGVILNDILSS